MSLSYKPFRASPAMEQELGLFLWVLESQPGHRGGKKWCRSMSFKMSNNTDTDGGLELRQS